MQDVMTARQAAEFLQTSRDTLIRKAKAGLLPAAKLGREWRFVKADLDAWLAAGGNRPEPEIDAWLVTESDKVLRDRRRSNEEAKAALGL